MAGPRELKAVATSYVDDNNNASSTSWLNESFQKFSTRFGGATRQQPPMMHVGVKHEMTDFGMKMSQDEFCQKLQPVPLNKARAQQDDSPLTRQELAAFRGLLGGLLWLCQTRLDAIADTVIIRQNTQSATI